VSHLKSVVGFKYKTGDKVYVHSTDAGVTKGLSYEVIQIYPRMNVYRLAMLSGGKCVPKSDVLIGANFLSRLSIPIRAIKPTDIKIGTMLIPNELFAQRYQRIMKHSSSKPLTIKNVKGATSTVSSADDSYHLSADFNWGELFDVVDDAPKEEPMPPYIKPCEGDTVILKNEVAVGEEVKSTNINRTVFNSGDLFKVFLVTDSNIVLVSKHTNESLSVTSEHFKMSFRVVVEPRNVKLDVPTALHQYLIASLEEAESRGSLVEVSKFHRGIGKTTALVAYAKLTDRVLVVRDEMTKRYLSAEHKTDIIFTLKEVLAGKLSGKMVELIVDEEVNAEQIRGMRYFKVVTGFKSI
jgi:hypothetical protein